MRFGSLFSGIGGLDLGLEMAGMECSWMVEVDKFGSQILKHHWPDAEIYGDIYTIDGKELEPVDLICGGFPCQPVSLAGKRSGTSDERWLWGEFARIIRQVKPRWVVAENVTGLLSANSGRAFAEVLRDLAESGYDAVWNVFPAGGQGGVGAPHQRQRIFIIAKQANVADSDGSGARKQIKNLQRSREKTQIRKKRFRNVFNSSSSDVADTRCEHGEQRNTTKLEKEKIKRSSRTVHNQSSSKRQSNKVADTDSKSKHNRSNSKDDKKFTRIQRQKTRLTNRKSSRKINIKNQWSVEPDVGRVAHGVPNRVDRLKALGNAVVPQVAKQIGEMIMEME